jgi:hypothetical protein
VYPAKGSITSGWKSRRGNCQEGEAEAAHLGPLVRYADDLVVLCASEAEAEAAHA